MSDSEAPVRYVCLRKREREGGGGGGDGGGWGLTSECCVKNKRNAFVFLNLQEYYVTR